MKIINIILVALLAFASSAQASPKIDLVILGGPIVTMDKNRTVIQSGAIGINKGRIVYVGQSEQLPYKSKKTLVAKDRLVVPGLINGHTHISMTLLRGISDDLDLTDWLTQHIWPAESKMNSQDVFFGALAGCIEMIQSGTTTFVDMYFFEDSVAQAIDQCGLRAILSTTYLDHPNPENREVNSQTRWNRFLEIWSRFYEQWKNHPRITPAIGPHAPYTVLPEHLQALTNLSLQYNVPQVIHVAETEGEVLHIRSFTKQNLSSPVQYLASLGSLTHKTIAAHVVWTEASDQETLSKHKVGVAHCPQSNLKLASGIADVEGFVNHHVFVSLGTDGAASNNDLNLWEEINLAALLPKEKYKDPKKGNAQQIFAFATIEGANAIHMGHEIGSIEVGKRADLILISREGMHHQPYEDNYYSELVYATKSSDVLTTIVDGHILMEERKIRKNLINAQQVRAELLKTRQRLQ